MKQGVMSLDKIEKMKEGFNTRKLRVLQNSVLKNGVNSATLNNEALLKAQHTFSVNIETGKVMNQKQSGRCWIFAALNTFRHKMNKEYNLKEYELSQTYVFFWDKFEKSNYFLDAIIKTKDEDLDSRLVRHILVTPQQDGGQWDMLVSLIQKYGVVPKYVMPEIFHSSNSMMLNNLLNKKLRLSAQILREKSKSASIEELYKLKDELMEEIFSFLCVMLGTPPTKFDFEYYDKDGKFFRDENMSPLSFYEKYVNIDLNEYVSIINATTEDKPFYKTFTVDFLGNVVEGNKVRYLNLPIEELKELTIKQLKDNETVWFGCDVGQVSDRSLGILFNDIFEIEESFGFKFIQEKDKTLDYCESLMTHAMVFSGVNLDSNDTPNRWKVENTWGDTVGNKGFFVMSDDWFDKYMYQVVINKKYLTEKQKEALKQEDIILKPWDPMGSLAK